MCMMKRKSSRNRGNVYAAKPKGSRMATARRRTALETKTQRECPRATGEQGRYRRDNEYISSA